MKPCDHPSIESCDRSVKMPEQRLLLIPSKHFGVKVQSGLEAAGHVVTAATTAGEALARLMKESFTVFVADIESDGVSGVEVLEAVRAYGSSIAAVITTKNGKLDTRATALGAQASARNVP